MQTYHLEKVRRELKRWVVRQCIIYGIAAYIAAVALIHPPFGMGEPNYLLQALVALAAAAIVGMATSVRASLLVQQILAASAGSTLSYRLGQSVA